MGRDGVARSRLEWPMNRIENCLSRGLRKLNLDMGRPKIVFGGQTIDCVPTTVRKGEQLQLGRVLVNIQLTVLVRMIDLPEGITVDSTLYFVDDTNITVDSDRRSPIPGLKCELLGVEYRIARMGRNYTNSHWELDLIDPNR
jgi:hypothetical protein